MVFKLPDFLLSALNLGGQLLAGFLSRFCHGWSLLSTHGQKKRAAVFCVKIAALGSIFNDPVIAYLPYKLEVYSVLMLGDVLSEIDHLPDFASWVR